MNFTLQGICLKAVSRVCTVFKRNGKSELPFSRPEKFGKHGWFFFSFSFFRSLDNWVGGGGGRQTMVYLVTEYKRKIPNLFKITPIRLDALKMFNLCECNLVRGKWSKSLGVLK